MSVEFNDQNFQSEILNKKGVFMVDFFASWCGPCRALGTTIEELAEKYEGKAVVGKYSTEENMIYAEKYEIRSIPCVKFFKDGEYQGEIIGLNPIEVYEYKIDSLLK